MRFHIAAGAHITAGARIVVGAALVAIVVMLIVLREKNIADAPMLPVNFAHMDHKSVNCIDCHHNFTDSTGLGLCFQCHKTDPTIAAHIEQQFHDLCRNCHVEKQALAEDGGPTRQCFACHEGDELP